jgi:predicted HicB family RNase H-like nuclease
MKSLMEYQGYHAKIEFDVDAKVFHGRVLGIKDVINFEGDSVDELEIAFKESITDYLAFCQSRGEQPEKPFSGKFEVRISPELHELLYQKASEEGISINKLVNRVLRDGLADYSVE